MNHVPATMLGMKKKKKKPGPHKGKQVNLRIYDDRLLAAIARYGKQVRHQRNMTITLLLEQALQAQGLWPPAAEPACPESDDKPRPIAGG